MVAKVEEVRGKLAVIRFEAGKCIHSRHCVLDRPDVFVPNVKGDWLHPDRATPDEIAELAHKCPSGAIQYDRLDGGGGEAGPRVNTIRVLENGPLAIHAPLQIAGQPAGFRATLCRCGASKNKPYCDGGHVAAGFTATGEPPTKDSTPLAVRNGSLTLTLVPNGPLQAKGPLEIVSGTGRTLNKVEETFLCRCGASKTKPYCDGSHKALDFTAP